MFISELAKKFGLSRSTLLYYDRIGFLTPSGRSDAGYRHYSQQDIERLAKITSFRQAGLTIENIKHILSPEDPEGEVLQRRLRELSEEIRILQSQQRLLGQMLQVRALGQIPATVDKQAWIDMLRAAGMDEAGMKRWHAEFERRTPEAHHQFLRALGVSEEEALVIREQSKKQTGPNVADCIKTPG